MAELKRPKKKKVAEATEALDSVRAEWMRRPGVTAVDVGFKISNGQLQDSVAVRVHVERKIPIEQLPESERLNNESSKRDKRVGNFPVDVIEATYGPANPPIVLDHDNEAVVEAIDRKQDVSPLIGGVSCGNPRITVGTLGSIVFDTATCEPMILSNWHVLAGSSSAVAGEAILQPGRMDGGTTANTVATLTRMELDSRMDAAVATLNAARPNSRDILGLGTIAGTESAALGMKVVKSGRTTGITRGVVDGVSMSTRIDYGDPGLVRFSDQIRIVPHPPWPQVDVEVSRGGDSGSVWLNEANNNAIGLHFAGETDPAPSSENAICNPIGPVMDELGFSFFPVVCDPQDPPTPPALDPLLRFLCMRFPFLCVPGGVFDPGAESVGSSVDERALLDLLAGLEGGRGGCGCSQPHRSSYDFDELTRVFKQRAG